MTDLRVGMAPRFPGAPDVALVCELLAEGCGTVGEYTPDAERELNRELDGKGSFSG